MAFNFNLDDLLQKAADAFEKSAEKHYEQAERAEQLADLVSDEDLREQFDEILEQGAIFGFTLLNRLKDIFPQSEEEPEPTPEPEPEAPKEQPDPLGVHEIINLLAKLNKQREQGQGYAERSGLFPTDTKTGGYPFPF